MLDETARRYADRITTAMDEAERKAYAKGFEDALKMVAEVAEIFLSLDPEGQGHDG